MQGGPYHAAVHKGALPVGFLGLGTMGSAMAGHLVSAGHPVSVWNRTASRTEAFRENGAAVGRTPAEVAASADVVVICVSDTPDVEEVLFAPDGAAAGARPGTLVIDCSTIAPSASRSFADRLAASGVAFVDAPVSGGSEGARNATLTIFVGGATEDVERARPILELLGRTITHMGPVGSGQAAKAVNQVMIAGTYLGVAEGILLAIRAGLDPDLVVEALSAGAAQSWVLSNRSGRMIANDYPLGFRVALHRKDLLIGLALGQELGLGLPVAALAAQLEYGLITAGYGDEDMSALARSIRSLSGIDQEPGGEDASGGSST